MYFARKYFFLLSERCRIAPRSRGLYADGDVKRFLFSFALPGLGWPAHFAAFVSCDRPYT